MLFCLKIEHNIFFSFVIYQTSILNLGIPQSQSGSTLKVSSQITNTILQTGNKLSFYGPGNTNYSSIANANASNNANYNLPGQLPSSSSQALICDTSGNMSWGAPLLFPSGNSSSTFVSIAGSWTNILTGLTLGIGGWLIACTVNLNISGANLSDEAFVYLGFHSGSGTSFPSDYAISVNAAKFDFQVPGGYLADTVLSVGLRYIHLSSPSILLLQGYATSTVSFAGMSGSFIAIPAGA